MNVIYDEAAIKDLAPYLKAVSAYPNPPTGPDGPIKWASVIEAITALDETKKHLSRPRSVLDIGAGNGALPIMLADLSGLHVTCVDNRDVHPAVKTHPYIEWCIKDAFEYLESLPDSSLDYAVDSCAVIHFDTSKDGGFSGNRGLRRISELLAKKLKIGGKFIIVTDFAHWDKDKDMFCGEFICAEYILRTVNYSNLKLIGKVPEVPKNAFTQEYSTYKLGIVRYVFERASPDGK